MNEMKSELEAILLLSNVSGFSESRLKELEALGISLVDFVKDPRSFAKEIPNFLTEPFANSLEEAKNQLDFSDIQKKCESQNIRIVTIQDSEYPPLLKQIHCPPLVLYLKGQIFPEDQAAVAVVGSRHPSPYGMRMAHRFSYELSECGVTVVSGLARGIDGEAHRGTLDARGRTIAVLGSGVDVVYPKENKKLYDEITRSGVLVSEFPLGTEPLPFHFPKRNRIIAGLSLGVLVVEAHSRSGSLITASLAAEAGREVYAVPGPVDSLNSRGTNGLIQEGAKTVTCSQDILEDLQFVLKDFVADIGLSSKNKPEISIESVALTDEEENVLEYFNGEPLTMDEVRLRSGFEFQKLSSILFQLETKGRVKKELGGIYRPFFETVGKDY